MTGCGTTIDRPASNASLILGAVLLFHFVLVVIIKIRIGQPTDLLWMSHVGLATAAFGFFLNKPVLVTAAFIELLALHSLWLYDCLTWMIAGSFPMGLATYLVDANVWVWTATAHHFFLLPLLLIVVRFRPARPLEALLITIATYLVLTCVCRAFTSPALNINYAYGVRISWEHWFWSWTNRNSNGPFYLLGLNAFVGLVMFLPAYGLVRHWGRTRDKESSRRAAHTGGYMGSSEDESDRCDSIGSSTTCTT
ncbi:MAG: hypothetical protein DHS20C16_02390 [Phycisphaerae bacterium]|nr:MAG: hypothetical protein DHS20C16_02390 [Phycisphaerae bacterium]